MLGAQTDFLVKLPVHRLLRRFAALDATLWKLPRMLADSLTPEDLVFCVTKDDADVRAIAFTVQHGTNLQNSWLPAFFHKSSALESQGTLG